jgi:four helix bundle protein
MTFLDVKNTLLGSNSLIFSIMTEKELKIRTRKFAVSVFKLIGSLPNNRNINIVANQLGRSASSVAANYRSAYRAKSHADFISKIATVEEEADESTFWLDFLSEIQNETSTEVNPLLKEARELTAIFTASSKTAKKNKEN